MMQQIACLSARLYLFFQTDLYLRSLYAPIGILEHGPDWCGLSRNKNDFGGQRVMNKQSPTKTRRRCHGSNNDFAITLCNKR